MLTGSFDKQKAEKKIRSIIGSLKRPGAFFKSWAHSVVLLARKNARSHSKGGGFWLSIANQTRITEASDKKAVVKCTHFAGWHKHHGGIIRAKKASALTIPICREAKGKRAAEFLTGGRRLFVPKGSDVLGYSGKSGFKGLYVLRKSVRQSAEPWWPSEDDAAKLGLREAKWWLSKQLEK